MTQIRSSGDKNFKEKYVSIVEDMFAGMSPIKSARERGIHGRTTVHKFWDELLLLKVNQQFLAQCISSRSEEELKQNAKPALNELFAACVVYLSDANFIRVAHALETSTILLREIFKKRFNQQGLTITTLVAGSAENADVFFKRLITGVGALLARDDAPVLLKSLCLRLYLTVLSATDNVNSNPLVSYFFETDVLESLVCVLSIKLTSDRKKLEVDVVLVLLLLLLWRESENIYLSKLSSPSAPVHSLLSTVGSLFSTSVAEVTKSVPDPSPGWEDMLSYVTGLLGFGGFLGGQTNASVKKEESEWCSTACGLVLLYFLIYLNPAFASNQVWPLVSDNVSDSPGPGQSVAGLWTGVFKSFIRMCQEDFLVAASGSLKIGQAKLALSMLRCMAENPVARDYLCCCDSTDFMLRNTRSTNGISAFTVLPFKSISCAVLDMVATILSEPLLDADLFYRAAVLVPIIFKYLKAQGWQLSSSSLNATRLWQSLMSCCGECAKESNFQRPGVLEVSEVVTGVVEWCLATSQDIFSSTEETEALHAAVICRLDSLERLGELLSSSSSMAIQNKTMVNVVAVKHHYEVQVAVTVGANGGRPTLEQALAAVRKKGMAGLKLKPRHAGPGRLYIEGTTELRVLNTLVRAVVNEQKKLWNAVAKLEHEVIT